MTDQYISIMQALQDCAPSAKQIRIKLGLCEVLAQLAEEAAELSQAALKLRRALDGTNPTPIDYGTAEAHLYEELADVLLCMDAVANRPEVLDTVAPTIRCKTGRWLERIKMQREVKEAYKAQECKED